MPAKAIKPVSNLHTGIKASIFWCDFQCAYQEECALSGPGRGDHKAGRD